MEPYESQKLYKNKKYEELAAIAQQDGNHSSFSEWDFFYTASAFFKLKQYQECLRLFKIMHEKYPDFDRLNDTVCWALYHLHLKDFDWEHGDQAAFRKQAEYILEHSSDSEYSPRSFVAHIMFDAHSSGKFGQPANLSEADRYLSMIDPYQLSVEPGKSTDGKELASDREKWYSDKIKLMKSMGRWQDCIDWAEKGLSAGLSLHYNNQIWWKYSQAIALRQMGKTQEARQIMEQLTSERFTHWALWAELFRDYAVLGNEQKAIYSGARAADDPSANDPRMLVSFLSEFAAYLMQTGHMEEAMLHRHYAEAIRQENNWQEKVSPPDWSLSPEIAGLSQQQTLSRLKPWWKQTVNVGKEWITGEVKIIFKEGLSGKIISDGELYYFNARDFRPKGTVPVVGQRVRFTLADRLDKKYGVVKKNAVEITLIK